MAGTMIGMIIGKWGVVFCITFIVEYPYVHFLLIKKLVLFWGKEFKRVTILSVFYMRIHKVRNEKIRKTEEFVTLFCFHFSSLQFFENTSIKAIWWRILYTWQWLYYEQLIFHRIYNKIQLLFIVLLFLDQTMNIPFPSPPVLVSTSLFPFLLSSSKPIIIFFLSPSTTPSPILIGVRPFRGVKALYLWSTVKYNLLTHFEKLNT